MTAPTAQKPALASVQDVARQFMELCNAGKNFDVMRTMYAPDMVSVEDDGQETVGQGPVIRKSEEFVAQNTIRRQEIRGPYFHGDRKKATGQFAVLFVHELTDTQSRRDYVREEIAVYSVTNGRLTREAFFAAGGM